MPQPLLLADTPHLLYRAFFALPDSITDADGRPVNALLGSVNQLLWCIERYEPRAVVCCFGAGVGRLPHRALPAVSRAPPADARRPRPPVGAGAGALRGARLDRRRRTTARGRRPDARLRRRPRSRRAAARRSSPATATCSSARATGSRSCSSARARRARTRSGAAEVRGALRDRPAELVPDFIALRGDPSDGLPGAKGIGEKTAADLLRRHGSARGGDRAARSARSRRCAAR